MRNKKAHDSQKAIEHYFLHDIFVDELKVGHLNLMSFFHELLEGTQKNGCLQTISGRKFNSFLPSYEAA
jgi:hypothetical protein